MDNVRLPVFRDRFSRLRGKMKQDEFAQFLGFSRPTVALYESGKRIPDAVALKTIAEKCDVSVDWLLGIRGTNIKTRDELINDICQYTGLREDAVNALHSDICFSDGEKPSLQLSDVINYILSDYGFRDEIIDELRTAYIVSHPLGKSVELADLIQRALNSGYALLPSYEASDLYINLALGGLYTIFREMVDKPIEDIIMNPKKGTSEDGQHIETTED